MTKNNDNSIKFHDGQKEVAHDQHRFKVLCCGRRWGKTIYDVTAMINTAITTHDGRIAYIAPTFAQARDIAWAELKKAAAPVAKKVNESRLEVVVHSIVPKRDPETKRLILAPRTEKQIKKDLPPSPVYIPSTSTIALRGWEAVETLRGQKFHLLVLDEVASMRNFANNWNEILLPALFDYRGSVIFSSTPKGFNHFYDLYNKEAKDPDYKSFRFPSTTNPHLPTQDLEKYRLQMTEDQYAQEFEADFRKMEGLVYKEFNRAKHVYNPATTKIPKYFTSTILGIDFGFTNPSAILKIQEDRDSHFWITEEYYEKEKTNQELIEQAKTMKPNSIYADPAEPDRIKEFKDRGFYMKEVKKGKDSIVKGIDIVRELLKEDRIHISNTCGSLIWEFEKYAYPENKTQTNDKELPVDKDNHALDALRYPLMMRVNSHIYKKHFGGTNKTFTKKTILK